MGIPPLKHVLDDLLVIPAATVTDQVLIIAKGTINPNYYANNNQVRNGSIITSLNILIDFYITDALNDADFAQLYDWYVAFNINGAQTLPNPNNVGSSPLQSQIFHQDQGVFPLTTANATAFPAPHLIRLKLDIPKMWRQINDNDQLELHIIKSIQGSNKLNAKIKIIYKEIFP